MRKVKGCTVIYKSGTNQIYNITVNTDGAISIPLLHYSDANDNDQPYRYSSFQLLYYTVLQILHNNNWYVGSHDAFGGKWYHIDFIDLNNPTEIHRFGTTQG